MSYFCNIIDKIKKVPWMWIAIIAATVLIGILIWRDYSSSRSYVPVVVSQKSEYYENRKGELYKASLAAILEVKDLKKQYDELYTEYDKLKKDKPLVITQTIVETRIDSVYIPTSVSNDGKTFLWEWHKDIDKNNFVHLEGETKMDSVMNEATTLMKSLRVGSDLYVDFISNKDYPSTLRVIARSNNPYVSVINTDGVIVDPAKHPAFKSIFKAKQKKWHIGLQAGFGASYDIAHKQLGYGPYVGIGVTKSIIGF